MIRFRDAAEADVAAIVALLSDDPLGQGRERADPAVYRAAFREISADPNNRLLVGEAEGRVAAAYQLTLIPGFALAAARRAQIEGVRVARAMRGRGYGRALLADAEARARAGGATLMQLAMNRSRDEARAFYEACGYVSSHTGFKKPL